MKKLIIFIIITAWVITAYAQPGSLDNTFGTNGIVTTPIASGSGLGYSIAIQPDGKIVVAELYYIMNSLYLSNKLTDNHASI